MQVAEGRVKGALPQAVVQGTSSSSWLPSSLGGPDSDGEGVVDVGVYGPEQKGQNHSDPVSLARCQ